MPAYSVVNAPPAAQVCGVPDESSLSTQCIAEGAGVFFLLMCVLTATDGQGWLIAAGLLVIISVFGPASGGGHFNPAITTVAYVKKDCDAQTAVSKIVSQLIGGLMAFAVWYAFYGKKGTSYSTKAPAQAVSPMMPPK